MLMSLIFLFFHRYLYLHALHSFPTRRSSDLEIEGGGLRIGVRRIRELHDRIAVGRRTDDMVQGQLTVDLLQGAEDRKSTRLNSSHVAISYAVFCLKKKKKKR